MTSDDERVAGREALDGDTPATGFPATGPPAAGGARERGPRRAWVRLVVLLVLFFLIDTVIGLIAQGLGSVPFAGLPVGIALAALVLLVYRWAVRRMEHREVDELARTGAFGQLGRGTLIGIAMFAVAIGILAIFGMYAASGGSIWVALTSFGLTCAIAATEELMFRGVLFRIVEEMAGTWGALIVSAVAFGGLHLVNPDATLWGAIAIAIEAGLMFGAAYAATRSLWLPIGMHLGWNFAEGGIFGVTVSGSHGTVGLLKGVLTGPEALTGGGFGPEGSVIAIVVCLIPTVIFLRMAARRGRILRRGAALATREP